jgi:hypothetical protein
MRVTEHQKPAIISGQVFFRVHKHKLAGNCIMTNVMHKFLIYLSVYFCVTCFGFSFSPSPEAGLQFRQWFKSPGYGVSARALFPTISTLSHHIHTVLQRGTKFPNNTRRREKLQGYKAEPAAARSRGGATVRVAWIRYVDLYYKCYSSPSTCRIMATLHPASSLRHIVKTTSEAQRYSSRDILTSLFDSLRRVYCSHYHVLFLICLFIK